MRMPAFLIEQMPRVLSRLFKEHVVVVSVLFTELTCIFSFAVTAAGAVACGGPKSILAHHQSRS